MQKVEQWEQMALGEAAKAASIDAVEAAASETFLSFVLARILALPAGTWFSTDNLWDDLPADITTREPRAMGAVMRRAANLGLITNTGTFEKSHRPECHRRPVALWRRT